MPLLFLRDLLFGIKRSRARNQKAGSVALDGIGMRSVVNRGEFEGGWDNRHIFRGML